MTPYRTSAAPAPPPPPSRVARLRARLRVSWLGIWAPAPPPPPSRVARLRARLRVSWLGIWANDLRAWRRLCGGRWERHFLDWPFLRAVWLPVEPGLFRMPPPLSVGCSGREDWP